MPRCLGAESRHEASRDVFEHGILFLECSLEHYLRVPEDGRFEDGCDD